MIFFRNKILVASIISGVIKGVSMLTIIALMILIGRYGGPNALGAYSLGITVLTIITLVSLLGLPTLMMRKVGSFFHHKFLDVDKIRHGYITALAITVGINAVIAIVLFFTADFLSIHLFNSELLVGVIKAVSVALLPIALITLHSNLIQGVHQPNFALTMQALCTPLFALAILVMFLSFGGESEQLASLVMNYYAVGAWLVFFISFFYWLTIAKGVLNSFSIQHVLKGGVRALLKQANPFLLAGIGIAVLNMTDVLMLGFFSTIEQTGLYSAASRLAAGLTLVLFSVNNVIAPKLASSFATGDMEAFSTYVRNATVLAFIPTLILVIVIGLFSSELLSLFGENFQQAQWIFIVLLAGNLINALAGPVGWVLNMANCEKDFQGIILKAAILNVFLNFVLISYYGALGAAFATMISTAAWNIHSAIVAYKRLGVCTVVGLNFLMKRGRNE
ncbi:MAG: oligosaccharide flippase family protein [Gammaproteobacteria bacterium]|nr:oligosaccharide flippase family protein [Gammaproteobacteria bacterium]